MSFEISDERDYVVLRVPPPQHIHLVVPLTFAVALCACISLFCAYQWLASVGTFAQAAYEISAGLFAAAEAFALKALSVQLAATQVKFERTVIEIKRSVLGINLTQQWYSCYRIADFKIVQNDKSLEDVRFAFVTFEGKNILIAERMPSDRFVYLVHLLRRKAYVYAGE